MTRRLLPILLAVLVAPVPAYARAPWSEIDGAAANPAHLDEVDLVIVSANTKRYEPKRSKIEIKPGPQWLTVASTRKSAGGTSTAMPYVFNAEPCQRYLLAAKHDGISDQRYHVIVVAVERIGECKLPDGASDPAPAPTPDAVSPPSPTPVAPAAEHGATSY